MSASRALQTAIYDALVADAAVGALVGDRIYDGAPSDRAFPNITFGPSQEVTDDVDCIDGEEHFVQLDVWTDDQSRLGPCKDIVATLKAALHETGLTVADPYALAFLRVTNTRSMIDRDGIRGHGIVELQAMLEI